MQTDHESLQLTVRKQLGAGGTGRILGGDHDEGVHRGISDAVYGDAVFLHDLKQSCLCPAGGAVDLIGEEDVAENGAGMQLRLSAVTLQRHEADDIAGQHIDGELHALGLQRHGGREGARHRGLAYAGDVLQQDVSFGQDGRQYLFKLFIFADDRFFCFVQDRFIFVHDLVVRPESASGRLLSALSLP